MITPTNGVLLSNPRPFFDWTDAADGESGVSGYTLRIASSNGMQEIPTASSDYTPTADLAPGAYTWTVRAHDGAGTVLCA